MLGLINTIALVEQCGWHLSLGCGRCVDSQVFFISAVRTLYNPYLFFFSISHFHFLIVVFINSLSCDVHIMKLSLINDVLNKTGNS